MNKSISILSVFVIVGVVTIIASVMNIQSVMAFPFPTCTECTKDFEPGQEAKIPGSCVECNGKDFAPGQEKASFPNPGCANCNSAKDVAPGNIKKDIGTIGQ